jgi:hypothetical protein
MARVMLATEIDAELRRQIETAAASSDQSVDEWIERVIERELSRTRHASGEVEIITAESGQKPLGLSDPPRLAGEGTLADMVIEDRR